MTKIITLAAAAGGVGTTTTTALLGYLLGRDNSLSVGIVTPNSDLRLLTSTTRNDSFAIYERNSLHFDDVYLHDVLIVEAGEIRAEDRWPLQGFKVLLVDNAYLTLRKSFDLLDAYKFDQIFATLDPSRPLQRSNVENVFYPNPIIFNTRDENIARAADAGILNLATLRHIGEGHPIWQLAELARTVSITTT